MVTAALAALLLLDLSGRTKAEAERIWLPYFPWLLAAAGAWGLGVEKWDALRNGTAVAAAQAVYAIVLSAMLVTLW